MITVTMKIVGGPPELSKHDLSINSAEEIVDCKEYLPYHLYTKIAFCMQPKRFISDSLLALCTAITAIEIKLCNKIILTLVLQRRCTSCKQKIQ